MDIVNEIVWQSLVLFLWIGSAVAFAVGLALLFAPARAHQANQFFARWIDTRGFESALDRPRWTERVVYRHHRLAGMILLAGSLFVLYKFLLKRVGDAVGPIAATDHFGLWQAMAALFVVGSVLGAVIGLIIATKPSLLRDVELASNKWISTERVSELFNRTHFSLDKVIFSHRKIVGLFLILSSSYVIFRLGAILMSGNWRV